MCPDSAVALPQVFELDRHLKQSGLANKAHVPWDGGAANTAGAPVLDVIRRLVHEIHVITHEAHKVEGVHPRSHKPSLLRLPTYVCLVASTERRMQNSLAQCSQHLSSMLADLEFTVWCTGLTV